MATTPANGPLKAVRGATWEETFTWLNPEQLPVDLTGYEARMQVRTLEGQYGLSTADTLLMELSTDPGNGRLTIDIPETGVVALRVEAEDMVVLNPDNLRKVVHCYSVELFQPAVGASPEYVVPLILGKVTIYGETTR